MSKQASTDKRAITDLALFGGEPAFDRTLHVGQPNVGNRQVLLERINDILDRRWLTNHGPYVQELERRLADWLGVKHCIATCNGTIALEILIRALGLTGQVIVPSFTFIATAHALQWQMITPVFCDIDPRTHRLDPRRVRTMITPRTTGIIGVHVWGQPCDVGALTEIADRHGIRLLFDAAHALGCSYRGRMIGNFGDAEVFSFHATKFFNTFEGGAVATNDAELAARIRLMCNFGFAGLDRVVYVGTNGKMSETVCRHGFDRPGKPGRLCAVNRRNYEQYLSRPWGTPGGADVTYRRTGTGNYQYVVLRIDRRETVVSRTSWSRSCMQKTCAPAGISTPAATGWSPTALVSPMQVYCCPRPRPLFSG
jgi:dTDP-4-amino-4,6-dideoxygalactose transaminase